MLKVLFTALAISLGAPPEPAILATVAKVIDGDTMRVIAVPWPNQSILTLVRLRGINTPEIYRKCERAQAIVIRDWVIAELEKTRVDMAPAQVLLSNIGHGKYAGRVLADVRLLDGRDLKTELLVRGYGRPYSGGKRQSFCDDK